VLKEKSKKYWLDKKEDNSNNCFKKNIFEKSDLAKFATFYLKIKLKKAV